MFLFERDTTNNVFFLYLHKTFLSVKQFVFTVRSPGLLTAALLVLLHITHAGQYANKQTNKQTKHTCPSEVEFVFPPQYLAIEKAVNVNITLVGTL